MKPSNLTTVIFSSIFSKFGTAFAATVVMALLLGASPVQATEVEVVDGNAIRITDLPIRINDVSMVFDVEFRYITGGELYGTTPPSAFPSLAKRTLL